MNPAFAIRRAQGDDAEALARVFDVTWRTAYREILPAAAFDEYLAERGASFWADAAEAKERGWNIFAAVDEDDDPVGLATTSPDRFGDECWGEVGLLYVMPGHQRQGLGGALLRRSLAELRRAEFRACIVWALEASDNGPFYERCGGTRAHRRVTTEWGAEVVQIGFVWQNLASSDLAAAPAEGARAGAGA